MSDNIQYPKVFISYSWDSEEHKKLVLALSNSLIKDGIDCQIDQYVTVVEEGWPLWMENQINTADFVLLVCTQKYHDRFHKRGEGEAGRGVAWEGAILTQIFYDDFCRNKRFIPVLPDKVGEVNHIPTELRDYPRFFIPSQYEDLLRLIMNRPKTVRPPLGESPQLPPEPVVFLQDFRNEKATQKVEITETQNIPCAVILTAIPEEYKAIRAYLTDIHEIEHRGTLYEVGHFSSNKVLWKVGIAQIGVGNDSAAFEAERAIGYFEPNIALFVGVAGGIKDVQLGDVVVATKVYGYESGRQGKTFMARPEVGNSNYELQQIAQHLAIQEKWWEPFINIESVAPEPRAFVGPIAAGNKVVTSTYSTLYKFLRNTYNDALAVEMEGIGFMEAIHANEPVAAIIVRGISDLIDKKSEADQVGSQRIAAQNASAFAFQMLIKKGEILFQRKLDDLVEEKQRTEKQVKQLEEEIESEGARLPEVPKHCRQAADWLKTFQCDLAQNAGKKTLRHSRRKNYSPEEVDNFLWEIEKLLELIYYCVHDENRGFLDGLGFRLTLPVNAYVNALTYIKKKRLPADPALSHAAAEIKGCLEYLIDRLEQRK